MAILRLLEKLCAAVLKGEGVDLAELGQTEIADKFRCSERHWGQKRPNELAPSAFRSLK
jgi:hypothetical protein